MSCSGTDPRDRSVLLVPSDAINQTSQLSLNIFAQKKTSCAEDQTGERKEAAAEVSSGPDVVYGLKSGSVTAMSREE